MADKSDLMVIVNPTSGRGKARRRAPEVVARLQQGGHLVLMRFTDSLDHARALAVEAVGNGRVPVAMGGDGLVSAVVNAIAPVDGAVMGLVPMGRGNDFARALGIRTVNRAVEAIASGHVVKVDLGYVKDRYFTCIASVGFDTRVQEMAEKSRFLKGGFVYPVAALRSLARWESMEFDVEIEGVVTSFSGYSVAVANGPYFGGGMKLAPAASLSDGEFDVVTISDVSKVEFLKAALGVFRGRHIGHSAVSVVRGQKVGISTKEPLDFYADGERVGPGPLSITVLPGALGIYC